MKSIQPERYRREGDVFYVDLHLRSIEQLFDLRDPAPFRERDLDDEAVTYVIEAMDDLRRRRAVTFRFMFASSLADSSLGAAELEASIRGHFHYEYARMRRRLSAMFRRGQIALLTAAAVLVLALAISAKLEPLAKSSAVWRAVREGLNIFGWVALWHPLDSLLFGWWTEFDRMRLLRRVERAPYVFVFDAPARTGSDVTDEVAKTP
jgi:hypothetical protein